MTKAIMIQGAGSNVSKSMLVAGIARACVKRGLSVAPFKPQNMSNNAAVTSDGGEIGRAQALQALAAGLPLHTDMNPVLPKPETDVGSQVIVQGRRLTTARARDYVKPKPQLLEKVLESYHRLKAAHDLIIVEGAGSPAEVNLRKGDIANMGFARAADVPVILAGDIDRGGVIAQIVGTQAILPDGDRALIKGFAINKFRGDVSLFDDGLREIVERTGWVSLGVLPWFGHASRVPAGDLLDLRSHREGALKVAVPKLNRISNFDDLDPLSSEPDVSVEIIAAGRPLPGDADLVLIPGSKATIPDLAHFRSHGWDIVLAAHIRRGWHVLVLCVVYLILRLHLSYPSPFYFLPASLPFLVLLLFSPLFSPLPFLSSPLLFLSSPFFFPLPASPLPFLSPSFPLTPPLLPPLPSLPPSFPSFPLLLLSSFPLLSLSSLLSLPFFLFFPLPPSSSPPLPSPLSFLFSSFLPTSFPPLQHLLAPIPTS